MSEHINHNHSEHDHDHHHHDISGVSKSRLVFVILFNFIIALAEIIGGIFSGSLSLVSDAVHNLSDTVSIILSYVSIRIAEKPKSKSKTYGYKRANILSAFINSATLIGIGVYLIVEAIRKFTSSTHIEGNIVIIVACIGLLGNLCSVLLLKKGAKENINIKSSYLHLASDTLSSLAVIISGVIIKFTSIYWVDPILTILINIVILRSSYKVLKESISILMQGTPVHIDVDELITEIKAVEDVKEVYHIHVWRLDEKNTIFEGHVQTEDMMISGTQKINDNIEKMLVEHFGINHVVIQFESVACSGGTCSI